MRSRLAALMLMGVLILMSAIKMPAAPRPGPASAVLDIGPPRKGETVQEHCNEEIGALTYDRKGGYLWLVETNVDVKKLPSVARLKIEEVRPWLAKNLRIKEERGGRHLRLTFGAGTRPEQVVILNALLVDYTGERVKRDIEIHERVLSRLEREEAFDAKAAKEARDPKERVRWQKYEAGMKATRATIQAEVDRLKQIAVFKWAK